MGDNTEISVSINTDPDGYLSQECSGCGKRFKVKYGSGSSQPIGHCPYCAHDGEGCWWTQDQADYLAAKAGAEVITPKLDKFAKDFNRGQGGGLINMSMEVDHSPLPDPPEEANDDWPVAAYACCGETIKHDPTDPPARCIICGKPSDRV